MFNIGDLVELIGDIFNVHGHWYIIQWFNKYIGDPFRTPDALSDFDVDCIEDRMKDPDPNKELRIILKVLSSSRQEK